jgi:Flp pilus assembly protein TadD
MRLFDKSELGQICRRKAKGAAVACGRSALAGVIAVLVTSCAALSPEMSRETLHPPADANAGLVDQPAAISDGTAAQIKNGRAQLAKHQAEPARATFADVLTAAPTSVPALNGLGLALDMLGRHDEAQTAYRQVLANVPDDIVARNNLGLSLTLSGRYSEAIAALQPIALGQAASPRARQNLAIAMALDGDRDGAAKLERLDMREEDVQVNLKMLASMRRGP